MSGRIVITGLGLISCISSRLEASWSGIINGLSGVKKISSFPTENLPVSFGGEVLDIRSGGDFDPSKYVNDPKDLNRLDNFILYGIAAADEAVKNSGILDSPSFNGEDIGVAVGSGIGGLPLIEKNAIILHGKGAKRVSPFFIPSSLINLISGHISINYGFTGPNDANVTACASGAHAIINSCRMIKNNEAKAMIAGGAEGALCPLGIAGFGAMRALSRRNDDPAKASRPWDKSRDGFVMSDGAGVLVLEDYEYAKKRGAKIYAEILGYGISGDAYHIAAPHSEGKGGMRAIEMALKMANFNPEDVDYINAHGTSTPLGDLIELRVIKGMFNHSLSDLAVSSTKSSIGHALGAAGGIEAILCVLAMRDSILPPTINLEDQELECEGVNLVPNVAQEKKVKFCLSNSFGFGGTNAVLLIGGADNI